MSGMNNESSRVSERKLQRRNKRAQKIYTTKDRLLADLTVRIEEPLVLLTEF